jgi:hypothetical protein
MENVDSTGDSFRWQNSLAITSVLPQEEESSLGSQVSGRLVIPQFLPILLLLSF